MDDADYVHRRLNTLAICIVVLGFSWAARDCQQTDRIKDAEWRNKSQDDALEWIARDVKKTRPE